MSDIHKLLNLFDTAAQAHGWASDQGTRAQAQTALANYQRARGDLEQALDAQAAEIARLNAAQVWQPIETAPKDGRTILLGRLNPLGNWRTMRGEWMSADYIAESWEDPDGVEPGWFETAVEAEDPPNCWRTEPTHWMPLPAAPDALLEAPHDR